ncbi:hypothetical protein PspLS_03672 [Pyricularia sp. CBS 133598]|nr:hypothetical protein PspLS_03672 [Pyricularia sp. CBS 133598]
MATATVTQTVLSTIIAASTSAATAAPSAPPQAGVLEGANPSIYHPKDPIITFIIQASIIIIFCRLLYYPLRYLGQPRVISEVIGGIVLGPSVMARIPGFQAAIFPEASIPNLNNVANLGLIFFMFITALEVDLRLFMENWKIALSVSVAGLVLPFAMGCGIAWGIYNEFASDMVKEINFGVFALFVGTALAITAFPVLCRILTELKLLHTSVGVTTLAAGVGNDVVGWILLALCVSLVNNASGLSALYALLCCLAWILFLFYAVKPSFLWILRRNGSLQDGPSPGMVTLTLLLVMASSFFTAIIGVHPIFGAFLIGLICPHEGGFAIKLTQKIEDFVGVFFLPLYFALSGLNTNIGLLNDGRVWAYVVAIILLAFAGKIIGSTVAARCCGLFWRESAAIGVLMSCKGLVELIVLNIGLQAGILSPRTFTMFVIMALVTTVTTTPLTRWLYPYWYQQKLLRYRRGEIDMDGTPLVPDGGPVPIDNLNPTHIRRVMLYLRLDSLPGLFTFTAILGGTTEKPAPANKTVTEGSSEADDPVVPTPGGKHLEVHGLRIMELTDRTSSVMQVTEGADLSESDPIVNTFRTFSQLNGVAVSGRVAIVPTHSYAETLTDQASTISSDLVLIPWSNTGSLTEDQFATHPVTAQQRFTDKAHLDFVNGALFRATKNTAVFIDNGFGSKKPTIEPNRPSYLTRNMSVVSMRSAKDSVLPLANRTHHLLFPFFGGEDDRVALRFVLQLAKNPLLTVTIAHFVREENDGTATEGGRNSTAETEGQNNTKSVAVTATPKGSSFLDEVDAEDMAVLSKLRTAPPEELAGRVEFQEIICSSDTVITKEVTELAGKTVALKSRKNAGDMVVIGRRHPKLGDVVNEGAGSAYDLRRTLGVVGEALAMGGTMASLLVVQAASTGSS